MEGERREDAAVEILVIEDEKKTAQVLRRGLTEQGFLVELRHDGQDGLRAAMTGQFDVIILDVMLPGRDGWSILHELRAHGKLTPILCLTARDSIADRVRGLESGADDYLVKPFAFSELLARIHSLLRRAASAPAQAVQVGDLEIDLLSDKASRGGRALDLTRTEFALLAQLARRHGETLSRQFLAEQVWQVRWSSDTNVVDVHIRRLRAKVDDPFPRKLIHTIRGVGYVLDERA
jgi:two-component system copper resistance phosphate regulon response regulator CusR